MNKRKIIEKTKKFAESKLSKYDSSHDFWHTLRVYEIAKKIAQKEKADLFIIEMAALLHDVFDWKYNDEKNAKNKIAAFLEKFDTTKELKDHISHIVSNVSFKGIRAKNEIQTLEGKIVQDADRLDSLGAIAIARTFAYGGFTNKSIHNPKIKPLINASKKSYTKLKGTSINHFYEKLLLIKDLMHTKTAKKIAVKRHKILENYLKEFFNEWDVKI